jgi:hypothetical protein
MTTRIVNEAEESSQTTNESDQQHRNLASCWFLGDLMASLSTKPMSRCERFCTNNDEKYFLN